MPISLAPPPREIFQLISRLIDCSVSRGLVQIFQRIYFAPDFHPEQRGLVLLSFDLKLSYKNLLIRSQRNLPFNGSRKVGLADVIKRRSITAKVTPSGE